MIHTPDNLKDYRRQLAQALDNGFLRQTLLNFARSYRASRAAAFDGLDFTALAAGIAEAKDQARPHMMELYQRFRQNAEAAGARVHLCATADQANRLIADLCRGAGAGVVVKSKSMTAEETHLNEHLEAEGLEVIETDLGEWIIQQRGEGPSHMVMPAIHLGRGQVAELFTTYTGKKHDPDDITAMVRTARGILRAKFLAARAGVSGANFAIAETGAIGLVTNEGNARLVTTLPGTHIALVGLDKLVPDLATALKVLKVLPKNATGQAISSYVTWISGANACAAGPGGVKDMHIVFLDNGRLALSRDPVFGQALRCVRCGACANLCPIYNLVGGHNYGHVYIGAIGLVLTLFYHGERYARALVQNCLSCGQCKQICPAGIDLPELIKKAHGLILESAPRRPAKNRIMALALGSRRRFHALLRSAWLAQQPLSRGQATIRHLPQFLGKEHDFRSLPAIARRPLRDRWDKIAPRPARPRIKAALFAGCLIDFAYPEMGEDLCALLAGRGVDLKLPLGQSCCGLPAAMAAEEELARRVARRNLAALDPGSYDCIVTLCASCAGHLINAYPRLLDGEPGIGTLAGQLAAKVMDAASFLELAGVEPGAAGGQRAAYHAPCHLCRGLGLGETSRRLLGRAGYDYAPYDEEEVCCGFAGSWSLSFPRLSAGILERKLDAAEATGAGVLVSDCPGCVLQLRGGLTRRGSAMRAMHLVSALRRAAAGPAGPDPA